VLLLPRWKNSKAAIAQYGEEVEKTVAAHERVAILAPAGSEIHGAGIFGEAYEAALKALSFYPTNSGLYYVAGLVCGLPVQDCPGRVRWWQTTREGWLQASEGAYKESIRLDERNTRSLYGLAVVYSFELENHEAAIPLLERMLGIDTMNMDALFLYARSLYGAGRMQDAVDVYDRIIAGSRSRSGGTRQRPTRSRYWMSCMPTEPRPSGLLAIARMPFPVCQGKDTACDLLDGSVDVSVLCIGALQEITGRSLRGAVWEPEAWKVMAAKDAAFLQASGTRALSYFDEGYPGHPA
jgi:tetratricopeptide (TPR) repeat protein